jgi:Dolichyl-phosphate-mannose-protein mannosyltransferase
MISDTTKQQSCTCMERKNFLSRMSTLFSSNIDAVVVVILTVGLILRLIVASQTCLNPDEAVYFWKSIPNEFVKLYQGSLHVHHPPLLVILTHYVRKISHAEIALRMIPLLSGALFPLFVYLWLGRAWNKIAGLLSLAILVFAPHIVFLSAQVRSYTLALFFISTSLYFLDRAIEEESIIWMVMFAGLLYIGIFTEYSFVFFVVSIGIYFLIRVSGQKVSLKFMVGWMITQLGAIALYGIHYLVQIKKLVNHPSAQSDIGGYLRNMFPWPGDNLLVFGAQGTVKQFIYLFASIPWGIIMGCVFIIGLILLWKGRSCEERKRTRAMLALFIMPFLFAYVATLARIYPYGYSRHTVFLVIFIASCVSLSLERIVRSRTWIVLVAIFLLVPFWYFTVVRNPNNIIKERYHQRKTMLRGINYIRKTIPPGSMIFTEYETRDILNYYLGPRESVLSQEKEPSQALYSNYHLVSFRYNYKKEEDFVEDFMKFREEFGIDSEESVWVIDGGWDLIPFKSKTINDLRGTPYGQDFGRVLSVFKTPPNYGPNHLLRTSSSK